MTRGVRFGTSLRALGHYCAGSFDESIHVALPRIEGVLRGVLVAAGGIAYTEPQGGRAGHDKTLGAILSELSPGFPDEGWRRSLLVVLTEPIGLNLRNRYLHGLVERAQKADAALVLHLAANLRLLVRKDADAKPRTAGSPGGVSGARSRLRW